MQEYAALSCGVGMPSVGIGTYKARGAKLTAAVQCALAAGTRLIDTATSYRNEEDVARAISENGTVAREEVFISSKIGPREMGTEQAANALASSLARLKIDFLDCMLIHWPGVAGIPPASAQNKAARHETWRVLEDAFKTGRVRSIGVSNFEIQHLQELQHSCSITPMVNQIEVHPLFQQRRLREYCKANDIQVVAYASLGCGELLSNETVHGIAESLGKTAAQVLLRWGLQSGCCVIPKSVQKERIQGATWQALSDWHLNAAQMEALDAMEAGEKFCWDPSAIL